MITAAQENTAVHRVIELASHLFSSVFERLWAPWTKSSLLCPLPTSQPSTWLAVQSERTGNFSSSPRAWHGIIATSLCPLQPTQNFLVLMSYSHAAGLCAPSCADPTNSLRTYWPSLPSLPFWLPHLSWPLPLLPQAFIQQTIISCLLRSECSAKKWRYNCESGLQSFGLHGAQEKWTNRCVEGAMMGKN